MIKFLTYIKLKHTTGLLLVLLCWSMQISAQPTPRAGQRSVNGLQEVLSSGTSFIENKGQYGKTMAGHENMGAILYGYEGLDMPILFTPKGLIHLQRKIEPLPEREKEKLERQGKPEEEIEREKKITGRTITMEWAGANPNPVIITEDKTSDYHTYGQLQAKAYGYKKITYKNIYPGIDLVYTLSNNNKAGFEYSLIVQPGADAGAIKLKYSGDVKNIKAGSSGNLLINSDINGISESLPVSYYGSRPGSRSSGEIKTTYKIDGSQVSFSFPQEYDHSRAMVIDPFVTATGNLTGLNAGKAKDVDFDYAGNIYVTGGGNGNRYQLAKYNAAGVLLWTFNGSQGNWTFGPYYGGWVVEKPTGNIYLGQGFNFAQGFIVIRIHTTGLYDNYTTTGNPNFRENWKMIWNCNSGSPQILVAGGGTNSNINMGTFTPPSVTISAVNISGIPAVAYQDMADMVIDPVTNAMYTTYAAGLSPSLNNAILKHTQPYSAATIAWQVQSGFPVLQEAANRPYLGTGGFGLQENSVNMLAVNTSYLYYWNGRDLKAIDKATGATAGTPLTVAANTAKMQGGIIADACNNVFVGDVNGTIKVYKFNGTTFDDATAPDITVTGFGTKSVYDLAYDESKKILYASGDGFVASFDVSTYCPTTAYTINVVPNCVTASATATLTPAPPIGSTVTYALYNGATLITTNTTGIFTGLTPNVTYTIIATINLACSGVQATATFTIPGPIIGTTQTNTTCGAGTGTITATGSGSAGPYTYNINGGAFGPGGNFTGLAAGNYTIIVKDAGGCPNTTTVTILNSNGPALSYAQVNADCGNNAGNVTANATGGTPPYQYSINGGTTYQLGSFFTGLVAGQYILMVKDAALCTNTAIVTITSTPSPSLVAIPAAASCGNNNGSITAFGSGGTGALTYSINGNTFQVSNTFVNLTPGTYTVTVKDANSCTKTATVIVGNSLAPTITATSTPAACGNINGTITATGAGGAAPLQYSINGISFQLSNVFTGLAAGGYTVTVQDASGCTKTVAVTVNNTGGPTVTATSLPSGCGTSTGSITITAAGTAPFQYSVNGLTFQASNLFTGLASGNYVVYARDAAGCIGTFTIAVTNVAGPGVSAVVTPASCSASDGMITATGSAGTPPYQYSKDGVTFGASNIFTGLSGNTIYTITVKDFNNCISTTTVTVPNVAGLTLAVSTISTSCTANSGVITATATGGAAPLTYSINGTVYQASNIFNGLIAGSYTVYVKDAGGCIITKPAVVSSVTGPSVTATVQLNATCSAANGVIIATGSGGAAPLTYSINGTVYQASGAFLNVAAGTYTVYVKDATGCIATQPGVVVTNSGVGAGISTFTVVTKYYPCDGDVVGKITNPRVNGANCGTCTFSLDFGSFIPNATQLFLNVPPGIHYVTAKDANGCTKTIQVNLAATALSTGTTVVTGTACNTSNGSILLTGIGPNTPYHASINGGATWVTFDPSTTFAGLAGGVYTIIIADDASFTSPPDDPGGCTTTLTVIVPSTGGPSLTTTQTNGSCLLNDGTITAVGALGTPPLNYNINGGAYQASGLFTGLGTGTYTVNVQDGTGCISTRIVTITNPPAPSVAAAITPAACNLSNGSVVATGTGGTAPLQYSIDGFAFQTSNVFSNLAPGTYTLYVRDASTCYSSVSVVIANTPLPQVTAFTIAATCNNNDGSVVATGSAGTAPYTFSIDGTVYQSSGTFSGLAAGFYTVTIKDDRGCTNTTGITVGNIGAPTFTTTTISAKCGNANGTITVTATGGSTPYQYSSDGGLTYQPGNILTPLAPGTYTVVVKDLNGCITAKAVLLGNINGPQTLTATIINAACGNANGSITAAATGGTAPLQYSIDGTTYQAATLFSVLAAGPYTLYVKDANGCIKTLPVTVLNLPAPTLVLSMSPASCGLSDGTITATATGGTLPLTYSKNGVTFQASNIFTGLAAGPYTITVKDARNCITTANITVTILGSPVTPTFNPVAAICAGGTLTALPTTSLNGITGVWTPALNNTTTTPYTFTPGGTQCATTTTLTITVNPKPAPILIYHN